VRLEAEHAERNIPGNRAIRVKVSAPAGSVCHRLVTMRLASLCQHNKQRAGNLTMFEVTGSILLFNAFCSLGAYFVTNRHYHHFMP
jgi:hypothetical protein